MSAEIIEFSEVRSRRAGFPRASSPRSASSAAEAHSEFLFWAGASGQHYVHTVHTLLACPELPPCTYVLAYRETSGAREVLAVGQLSGTVPSLNLAELRHRGARLGANEIHVHLLAPGRAARNVVVADIKSALAGEGAEMGGLRAKA